MALSADPRRARYGASMWGLVLAILLAVVTLGGAAVWIVGLLWAAREDGRDQKARDAALRGDDTVGPVNPKSG
jgi:hypothetical protein